MDSIAAYGPSFIMLILGVLLLFAAIIGGGLEIKELKIPKIGTIPRILTSILGMMLMMGGVCVGAISLWAGTEQSAPPTEVANDYIPDTTYITVEKVQLPEESEIPQDVQSAAANLIVNADIAEILAVYYQDDYYLKSYYAGDALQRLQDDIESVRQSGQILILDIDLNKSYYVNMRLTNGVLSIDECEYWQIYYYDSSGNFVNKDELTLVPQTISIEAMGDSIYITAISFYQNNAFCTR